MECTHSTLAKTDDHFVCAGCAMKFPRLPSVALFIAEARSHLRKDQTGDWASGRVIGREKTTQADSEDTGGTK
jgi:hypothetical protein